MLRFVLVAISAGLMMTGCQNRNDIIDRSVDPFWSKAPFQDGKSWYYGMRVVDSAPNQSIIPVGDSGQGFALERIKWEVTESHLIGYRDFSFAPGTNDGGNLGYQRDDEAENDENIPTEITNPGGEDTFFGEPIIALPISSHFDRIRAYVGLTGEETNEIVENTTDRPWYEREYFRVDWGATPITNWPVIVDEESYQDPADPRRWRFELNEGYFEFTNRYVFNGHAGDILGIFSGIPGFNWQVDDVASDVKFSFWRIDEASDYIPLNYPETMVLVDENGEEVRDEDELAQRTPIGDRFGYFTLFGRKEFDPRRGQTAFNQIDYINRFNIWKEWRDEDGDEIPVADREANPIVWYTNVDHPEQLLEASFKAAEEWNDIFRDLILELQPSKYDSRGDVPDMFVLKENDCNVANVKEIIDGLSSSQQEQLISYAKKDYVSRVFDGTIASVEDRLDDLKLYDSNGNFIDPIVDLATYQGAEIEAKFDLERICTGLEWLTRNDEDLKDDADARFTYQRVGDIRFNMVNGIPEFFSSGWSGLATILPDPTTGEEVHGTANMAVWTVDRAAYRYNEAIEAIKGELGLFDVFSGVDIKNYIDEKVRIWKSEESNFASRTEGKLTKRVQELMSNGGLKEISPNRDEARMSRAAGTAFEKRLISPEQELFWANQIGEDDIREAGGNLQEAILEKASPARGGLKAEWTREDVIRELGQHGIDPTDIVDQYVLGLSSEYGLIENPRERFFKIRSDLYFGILTHEIGHTIALRHNFGSSMDALNYHDEFWDLQRLPEDPNDALVSLCNRFQEDFGRAICEELGDVNDPGDVDDLDLDANERRLVDDILTLNSCIQDIPEGVTDGEAYFSYNTKSCFGVERYMVSSTMEYPGVRTSRVSGLGKYDKAAVFFGYGQLVEVLDEPVSNRTEKDADNWLHHNDWRTIPGSFVQDYGSIDERSYIPYDWNFASAPALPVNTVPYRYCSDIYRDVWCMPSDFGADFQENQSFNEYSYFSRYFFTHFNRDRYWDINTSNGWTNGIFSDFARIDNASQKMKWFTYLAATDPDFAGSFLESDLEKSTYRGLNMISHILSHPSNGRYLQYQENKLAGLHLLDQYEFIENGGRATDYEWTDMSPILAPWDWVGVCEYTSYLDAQQLTQNPETGSFEYGQNAVLDGVAAGTVPLGDGRPTYFEYTGPEQEDLIVNYVGAFWAKDYALQDLVWSGASFPRTEWLSDPRTFSISWYQLFPEEVGEILRAVITEEEWRLGGTMDENGRFNLPDLVDPETGAKIDLSGQPRVFPNFVRSHTYGAMLYAAALGSARYDGSFDMSKAMMLATDGAEDDNGALDPSNTIEDVIEYVDPISGLTYQALDYEPLPIAADMIKKATVLAQRYEDLTQCEDDLRPIVEDCTASVATLSEFEDCVEDEKTARGVTTPDFCGCFNGDILRDNGDFGCANAQRALDVGAPACTFEDLENRADSARESLLFWMDTINYLRELNRMYGL